MLGIRDTLLNKKLSQLSKELTLYGMAIKYRIIGEYSYILILWYYITTHHIFNDITESDAVILLFLHSSIHWAKLPWIWQINAAFPSTMQCNGLWHCLRWFVSDFHCMCLCFYPTLEGIKCSDLAGMPPTLRGHVVKFRFRCCLSTGRLPSGIVGYCATMLEPYWVTFP